ncbi:hypothetical protein PsYK624_032440 [Phanerochaete sordida]|uniref:RlpA-like protein double-psi beta-barrel domain-containing protein n=1 Tax=Phanerochaete sordida TaxID=48140 RepID=A0A9P3L9E1_9APHY|nr:hypothetical protein PsYK624_032440 [Phanerochaete sordida]
MFKLVALTLCAISAVRGVVIPLSHRDLAHYDSADLEPYSDYSTRYQLLDCASQHNTQFFDDCCHPLLKGQSLSDDRKPYCIPQSGSASVAPATAAAVPSVVNAAAPPPSSSAASPTTPAAAAPAPSQTGHGTWFTQNNNAGACGTVHQDSDKVVALDSAIYDNGKWCGKSITITNLANGKTVQATVADECPTCDDKYSVDMSQGAFDAIGAESTGLLNIMWVLEDFDGY